MKKHHLALCLAALILISTLTSSHTLADAIAYTSFEEPGTSVARISPFGHQAITVRYPSKPLWPLLVRVTDTQGQGVDSGIAETRRA
jgi:hypothetical protein